MSQQIEKLIATAHCNITRIKGKEYSPTVHEIEKEIIKIICTIENK